MKQTLRECILFQGLNEEEWNVLLSYGTTTHVAAGQYVFQENEPGTTLYVLLEGKVRVHKKTYRGQEEELATLSPSDFFGEMAILDEQLRSATVQALEPTTLFVIDRKGFEFLASKNPSLLYELARVLVARLRAANEKISRMEKAADFQEKLLDALSKERRRIAMDLHDGPIQMLSSLAMDLSLLEATEKKTEIKPQIHKLAEQCTEIAKIMREAVFNLFPRSLEEKSINQAIADRLEEIKNSTGIAPTLMGKWEKMPLPVARVLFSIFLESTNNVIKHAQASHLSVELMENESFWQMQLADDGVGFAQEELEKQLKRKDHFGIASLRERVESLGGEFQLRSRKNEGTVLTVKVPRLE